MEPIKTSHRTIYAVLLTMLLQLLWISIDSDGWESSGQWKRSAIKISAGFPSRCVSHTFMKTEGNLPANVNYPDRAKFLPGLNISPSFLAFDALGALTLFFVFEWLLRFAAGRTASLGIVLGSVLGMTIYGPLPVNTAVMWCVILLFFVFVPAVICALTRRANSVWPAILILVVSMAVMPWADLDYGPANDPFDKTPLFSFYVKRRYPSLDAIIYFLLACGILLIPLLLMRRFVPFFRKRKNVDS